MGSKRKSEIENDLRNDDQRYSFVSPACVRSSVWKNYKVIKFLDTVQPFARCNRCAEILSYAPRSGTGSLLRHRCGRAKTTSLPKDLSPTQNFLNSNRSTLPKKANESMAKSQLEYILKDLRSLNSTEGDGFKKFAQDLINIGAEYGNQNIDEILVSRANMINSLIPAEYFNLRNKLDYVLSNNYISFTTNMWIDDKSRRSFLTLTAHYINDDFVMDSSLLGTRELTHHAEKPNDLIHFFVMDILNGFGMKDKLHQGVIVTENSSEFIETFRCYKRISCICHSLSLFMKETLENSTIKEVKELIQASKSLIKFCESLDFSNPIVKPNESEKFNYAFSTLSYVFAMYNELEQALSERNEWKEIGVINYRLLESVLSFFGPFKDCFDILSMQSTPNIAEYCMLFERMRKCCLHYPKDSDIILELKTAARGKLETLLKPDILHYVAFLLNPIYKTTNIMSEDEFKTAQDAVKMLLDDSRKQQDISILMLSETVYSKPIFNAHKGQPFDVSEEVTSCNLQNEIDNELQTYFEMNTEQFNILEFWKATLDLPLLRGICRQILNIPTSCMTCGGIMFTLGNILEEGQANISSETIDQLLFLHINTGYASQNIIHSMDT